MPLRHIPQTVGLDYQRLRQLLAKQGVYKVPPPNGRPWSEREVRILRRDYGKPGHSLHTIAAKLGRTWQAVGSRRQDFFEYRPQFKLVIAGNHKPRLTSVDEAIRRRFHLVPFTVTIGPDKRDLGLKKKLKAEWSGILQWMIDGCINWQEFGLAPPDVVTNATKAYLAAEDVVSNWIADCCEVDPNARDTIKRLYASQKERAEQAGERAQSCNARNKKGFCYHPAVPQKGSTTARKEGGNQGLVPRRCRAPLSGNAAH
jgi:hypothetical protein